MRDKRVKLVFFSLRGSEVKDFDLGWKKVLLFLSMLGVILIILSVSLIVLFSNFYRNSRFTSLQQTNQILKTQLGEMRKTVTKVTDQIEKLEAYDNEQRLISGLNKIDNDMRNAGRGGPYRAFISEANILPRETHDELSEIKGRIDQLEGRINLVLDSQNEINQSLEARIERFKHLPTINPVDQGRITDYFGNRIDPFIERPRLHTGIDIAAPPGTDVYAAADGVVELVNHSYSPNRDYGKYIIINHDFGKQTLYAHLSQINIKVGQKVKRWDIIGLVGETGRATGPHLHYEVRENETPVNPISYLFE